MQYIYWSNKTKYHDELLFKCLAESITEADKLFFDKIGIDPIKMSWVGCQILPDNNGQSSEI